MKNYVVTGFNEPYWKQWGSSWLTSLREFTSHDLNKTIIIGYNLSANIQNNIRQSGATLICKNYSDDIYSDTMRAIVDLAKKESAVFAYWHADVFFQEDISEIFEIAKNDLSASTNQIHGFLAGPSHQWMCVQDVMNIMSFMNDKSSLHKCLTGYFGKLLLRVDNTWNFTDIPSLKDIDGKLTYKGKIQKVIHPSGQIKKFLDNKNILFWERHKHLSKNTTTRKLFLNNFIVNNKK